MNYLTYLETIANAEGLRVNTVQETDRTNTLELFFLIDYECRATTSQFLQLTRYSLMNALSEYSPAIASVVEKMDMPIRSWLHLYLWHKHKRSIVKIIERFASTKCLSYDADKKVRVKLPRLFTEGPDYYFDSALMEIYLCMEYDKDRKPSEKHAQIKLLDKIIECESEYRKKSQFRTYDTGIKKERVIGDYSPSIIKAGVDIFKKNNVGSHVFNYHLIAKDKDVNPPFTDLLTFKASLKYDNINMCGYSTGRTKCIQSIGKIVEEKHKAGHVISNVWDLYESVKHDKFDVISEVFMKNQIGSTREIHILNPRARIFQFFIERISAWFCKFIENEMLTKGSRKYGVMTRMISMDKIKINKNSEIIHFNEDRSRWGPSMSVESFMDMYNYLLEDGPLKSNLLFALSKFRTKYIIAPYWIRREYTVEGNPKSKLFSASQFGTCFSSPTPEVVYLENNIGMWQGILHVTSSLYHSIIMNVRMAILRPMLNKFGAESNFVVSSDDCYSYIVTDKKERMSLLASTSRFINKIICENSNIKVSYKDSIGTIIGEFNSAFITSTAFRSPLIKFSIASCGYLDTSSYSSMVIQSYNYANLLLDNGASLDLINYYLVQQKRFCNMIYNMPLHELPIERSFSLINFPLPDSPLMLTSGPYLHDFKLRLNPTVRCSYQTKQIEELISFSEDKYNRVSLIEPYCLESSSKVLLRFRESMGLDFKKMREYLIENFRTGFFNSSDTTYMLYSAYMKLFSRSAHSSFIQFPMSYRIGRMNATLSLIHI